MNKETNDTDYKQSDPRRGYVHPERWRQPTEERPITGRDIASLLGLEDVYDKSKEREDDDN